MTKDRLAVDVHWVPIVTMFELRIVEWDTICRRADLHYNSRHMQFNVTLWTHMTSYVMFSYHDFEHIPFFGVSTVLPSPAKNLQIFFVCSSPRSVLYSMLRQLAAVSPKLKQKYRDTGATGK